MVLPPEESIDSETAIENLIDTSDTGSLTGDQLDSVNTRNGSISPDALAERYKDYYFCLFLYYFVSFFLIKKQIRYGNDFVHILLLFQRQPY